MTEHHSVDVRRVARKLTAYAAAGAALPLAEASASIVYTDLRPDGIEIGTSFDLDLNGDGRRDFRFRVETRSNGSYVWTSFRLHPQFANAVVKTGGGYAKLPLESVIDSDVAVAGNVRLARCDESTLGASYAQFFWEPGYVGLSFDVPTTGRLNGWAEIEVLTSGNPGECVFRSPIGMARINRYAYETMPGKPILAGDTGVVSDHFGDTNADGKVDILDLNNVRNNFGATGDGVLGDTNSDDVVDIQDLNDVRNNFGATSGANPVPEPPSLVLLAAGAAGLAAWRRNRAKQGQS